MKAKVLTPSALPRPGKKVFEHTWHGKECTEPIEAREQHVGIAAWGEILDQIEICTQPSKRGGHPNGIFRSNEKIGLPSL